MAIGDEIKQRRRQRRMTQAELSDAVGVGQTTISKWESGKSEPSQSEIARLADVLGALQTQTLAAQAQRGMVPVMGYVAHAQQVIKIDPTALEYIELPEGATLGTQAIIIRGQSFLPFKDGTALFFWAWTEAIDLLVGELCVVELADGRIFIRQIERGAQPNRWTLLGHSRAPTIRDAAVKRAALIEGHIRKPRWITPSA